MPVGQRIAAIAPLVLALVCCLELSRKRTPRPYAVAAAALLVATLLIWMRVQKVYEGPTVVRLTEHHGLTIADLDVVPGFAIAAAVARKRLLNSRFSSRSR